ncbi:MAG TPA: hypothetical protein VK200_02650 [Candidatus Limnocylindrales bacterium]|nr:hypothetical protein [Candidatus Limnocylindrales bacterium]
MRFFFRLIWLLIFALPLALGLAIYLAFDSHPTIDRAASVTPASVERAKQVLQQNDPRKLKSGDRRTVSTSAADLDLAANYLAQQFGRGSARVELRGANAYAGASLRLPLVPIPLFVNIDAALAENDPTVRLDSLRIGQLPVPAWLARWSAPRLLSLLLPQLDYNAFINAVKKVSMNDARLSVTYQWQSNLAEQMGAVLVPPEEQNRLKAYHERLAEVSRTLKAKNVSIAELLTPLFKLAAERSDKNSAAAENRAAILVLAVYVNGGSLEKIVPDAKNWPRTGKHGVLLTQRDDFPKHFIISAALAANAGGPLADAVGVYKEISDSRGGSGFSFNDIAADRAGTRFGEYAAQNASAKKLQQKLATGIGENDLMPTTADLPEFMQESEFKRRFGGIDGPEYKNMMADIDRRVAALPLYR